MTLRQSPRAELPALELREVVRSAALAAATGTLILLAGPRPGDEAAHLYRTWLVERGVLFWDNLWFGGSYPLVHYSALYYLAAAVVGNLVLVFAGVLTSAMCFTALTIREWGARAIWPARLFAILAAGQVITGTYAYGVGQAAGLATLLAFQRGRRGVGVVGAAVTLALSPLAFLFLCLVLTAIVLGRRLFDRGTAVLGFALAVLAVGYLSLRIWFPHKGNYPFAWWTLIVVTVVAGCGFLLAGRHRETRVLRAFFALWLLTSAAMFLVPTPIGEIVTRLRYLILPVMLLTCVLVRFRPRGLAVTALVTAALYNLVPHGAAVTVRVLGDENSHQRAFWEPAIDYLRAHRSPDHLVTVVTSGAHWESYWLPRSGIPLVRGWYRQTDIVRNPALYDPGLTSAGYRRWLAANAVRFVVLPHIRLDVHTGDRERELVTATDTALLPVLTTPEATIYRVPQPARLLTGPAPARIVELDHQHVTAQIAASGTYRLRLHWSPHWHVEDGDATLTRNPANGRILLHAGSAGTVRLEVGFG